MTVGSRSTADTLDARYNVFYIAGHILIFLAHVLEQIELLARLGVHPWMHVSACASVCVGSVCLCACRHTCQKKKLSCLRMHFSLEAVQYRRRDVVHNIYPDTALLSFFQKPDLNFSLLCISISLPTPLSFFPPPPPSLSRSRQCKLNFKDNPLPTCPTVLTWVTINGRCSWSPAKHSLRQVTVGFLTSVIQHWLRRLHSPKSARHVPVACFFLLLFNLMMPHSTYGAQKMKARLCGNTWELLVLCSCHVNSFQKGC